MIVMPLIVAGCQHPLMEAPPDTQVTEIQPSGRPSKPPGCDMPVLRQEPATDYTRIALIEGTGSVYGNEDKVLPLVKRRGCEVGADALLILTSTKESRVGFTAYYIDAAAIIYEQGSKVITAPTSAASPAH